MMCCGWGGGGVIDDVLWLGGGGGVIDTVYPICPMLRNLSFRNTFSYILKCPLKTGFTGPLKHGWGDYDILHAVVWPIMFTANVDLH